MLKKTAQHSTYALPNAKATWTLDGSREKRSGPKKAVLNKRESNWLVVMERTYVMIKPDGVGRGLMGEIISRIERKGLKIVAMKLAVMDESKAKEHYAEHVERPFFKGLVDFITSAPSLSLVIEGRDAIKIMRAINGATKPAEAAPGTIRGDFAMDTGRNIVHASDSAEAAEREIKIHFGGDKILSYKRADDDCLYE